MKKVWLVLLFMAPVSQAQEPTTVKNFELSAYLGKWFEIERIPNRFQDNRPGGTQPCRDTTAEYTLRDDKKIAVENRCVRVPVEGPEQVDVARAVARVPDAGQPAKLKVNFTGWALLRWLGVGDGDYWICALGPQKNGVYAWSLVCSPSRKYGWVLSRRPELSPDELVEVRQAQASAGYAAESFQPSK